MSSLDIDWWQSCLECGLATLFVAFFGASVIRATLLVWFERKVAAASFVAAVAISAGWRTVFSFLSKLLCALVRWVAFRSPCLSFRVCHLVVGWSCWSVAACFSLLRRQFACVAGSLTPPPPKWGPSTTLKLETNFFSTTLLLWFIDVEHAVGSSFLLFPYIHIFFCLWPRWNVFKSYFWCPVCPLWDCHICCLVYYQLKTEKSSKKKKAIFLSKWMSKTRNRGKKRSNRKSVIVFFGSLFFGLSWLRAAFVSPLFCHLVVIVVCARMLRSLWSLFCLSSLCRVLSCVKTNAGLSSDTFLCC